MGGSLGSKTINESISQNLNLFKKHKLNLIKKQEYLLRRSQNELTDEFKLDGISSHVFIKEMVKPYVRYYYFCCY